MLTFGAQVNRPAVLGLHEDPVRGLKLQFGTQVSCCRPLTDVPYVRFGPRRPSIFGKLKESSVAQVR